MVSFQETYPLISQKAFYKQYVNISWQKTRKTHVPPLKHLVLQRLGRMQQLLDF